MTPCFGVVCSSAKEDRMEESAVSLDSYSLALFLTHFIIMNQLVRSSLND